MDPSDRAPAVRPRLAPEAGSDATARDGRPGSGEQADPAGILDGSEARKAVLGALWRIPATQREVVALHYIEGLSQREIAALIGLPVTTVNNRMHEGRRALRRELVERAAHALRRSRLPVRFADRVGTILRVCGPVVDVRFEVADLPEVLETISLRSEAHKCDAILEVVQRRGHGVVRCLATSPERIATDRRVRGRERPASGRSPGSARAAILALHGRRAEAPSFLETGIKAIDLLCPIGTGGTVAIVGDVGVGKLVLVQELARRLAGLRGGLGVFTFVHLAEQPWARDVAAAMEVLASRPNLTFFLAAAEREERPDPTGESVDTLIHLSRDRAEHRIYPAIDPLRSRSSLLTAATVGRRHVEIAGAVRDLVRRFGPESPSGEEVRREPDVLADRAWKLQLYLSQPFFVAQPFTKVEGTWVRLPDTLAVCRQILDGRHDEVPREAFWFVGGKPRDPRNPTAAR